ncbi:hypothetical protein [Sorangium sp. So ce381]|uniref:hypothetical protein n=1 Tax=Sorangium sp. So ce381 TaxID=3133307 RepID=UPI003F5BE6E6
MINPETAVPVTVSRSKSFFVWITRSSPSASAAVTTGVVRRVQPAETVLVALHPNPKLLDGKTPYQSRATALEPNGIAFHLLYA